MNDDNLIQKELIIHTRPLVLLSFSLLFYEMGIFRLLVKGQKITKKQKKLQIQLF